MKRKSIEQYSQTSQEILKYQTDIILRIWSKGCYHVILNDVFSEEASTCWQKRYEWVQLISNLSKRGQGNIPPYPPTLVKNCEVCFYKTIARKIQ